VKLSLKEVIQQFRLITPKQVLNKAEKARVNTTRALNSPLIAATEIFAAGQLKSGDL
jgi:hypothetical protein